MTTPIEDAAFGQVSAFLNAGEAPDDDANDDGGDRLIPIPVVVATVFGDAGGSGVQQASVLGNGGPEVPTPDPTDPIAPSLLAWGPSYKPTVLSEVKPTVGDASASSGAVVFTSTDATSNPSAMLVADPSSAQGSVQYGDVEVSCVVDNASTCDPFLLSVAWTDVDPSSDDHTGHIVQFVRASNTAIIWTRNGTMYVFVGVIAGLPAFNDGDTYALRFQSGTSIGVYVNGTQVGSSVTVSGYTQGNVGWGLVNTAIGTSPQLTSLRAMPIL